jgi:hypothetical protein
MDMGSLLWGVVVVLVVLWALGFFVAHIGSLIHFLLVLAVIALIWNLITSSRSRAL